MQLHVPLRRSPLRRRSAPAARGRPRRAAAAHPPDHGRVHHAAAEAAEGLALVREESLQVRVVVDVARLRGRRVDGKRCAEERGMKR